MARATKKRMVGLMSPMVGMRVESVGLTMQDMQCRIGRVGGK